MSVLKLKACCKDYLWGGNRLIKEYGKEENGDVAAESWELSCHPDGPSRILNGPYAGKTLQEYIDVEGRSVLGENCRRFEDFPILIKLIDARESLSIQVHPDDEYARSHGGQYGKTEMWYILDAGEDAFLYYGFKKEITKEEILRRIEQNTLTETLNAVPVSKGDVFFIESGTVHAIGKDILLAEIQENSNLTYRIYDFGRVGKDGKPRPLHLDQAMAVVRRMPMKRGTSAYPHVADCDYFTVDRLNLNGTERKQMEGVVTDRTFVSVLFLDGFGTIASGEDCLTFKKGDSFFLPAGSGDYRIKGNCDALITTIRGK